MAASLLEAALAMEGAGCSVVPARGDGSKRPDGAWKRYQTSRASPAQLADWFSPAAPACGLGVVCGAVSGNLEMLEVEGHAVALVEDLAAAMTEHGYAELWGRLCTGWLELSPTGGLHWHFRVAGGPARPNTKLARRLATGEEMAANPGERVKVMIETRGEGGFVVTAPSNGTTHPSGRAWTLLAGGPGSIPTLTVEERDALHLIAGMCDQMPAELDHPIPAPSSRSPGDRARPGDDYNTRADWAQILGPHGWVAARRLGGRCIGWRRPGKTDPGISATTGRNDADNLYVFSTSTEFPSEVAISKFGAYTLLHHGGDYAAAAGALRVAGYGAPLEPTRAVGVGAGSVSPDLMGDLIAPDPAGTDPPIDEADAADQGGQEPRAPAASTLERSEDGHAQTLIDRYGELIRYCPERGRWLAWDGALWRWQPEDGGCSAEARQGRRAGHCRRATRRSCCTSAGPCPLPGPPGPCARPAPTRRVAIALGRPRRRPLGAEHPRRDRGPAHRRPAPRRPRGAVHPDHHRHPRPGRASSGLDGVPSRHLRRR